MRPGNRVRVVPMEGRTMLMAPWSGLVGVVVRAGDEHSPSNMLVEFSPLDGWPNAAALWARLPLGVKFVHPVVREELEPIEPETPP